MRDLSKKIMIRETLSLGWGGDYILYRLVGKGLDDNVTFEQRAEVREKAK